MIIGLTAGGIVFLLALYAGVTYNGFVKMKNNVEEGFSTMDVYLKKRYDLIPNLVETVKGYAAHEKETLENVTAARSAVGQASQSGGDMAGRAASEDMLSGALSHLFAVAENYPDLKANTNFLDLQRQLETAENDIANARKYYNGVVKTFNTKCDMFPSNIIAGMFHFERFPMFETSSDAERENVKVDFS